MTEPTIEVESDMGVVVVIQHHMGMLQVIVLLY